MVWSNASAVLSRKSKVDLSTAVSTVEFDEEHAVARRKLGVGPGAGGRLLAEEDPLRLFLALDVERHVDARLGEAVGLQVGRILVDDTLFLEVREVRDDIADAVAIGRRFGGLNDRPGVVRALAERGDLAAAGFDLNLVDLGRQSYEKTFVFAFSSATGRSDSTKYR